MSETLQQIAQELKCSDQKTQLIYAFNGSGKTRLSLAFKELIDPKAEDEQMDRQQIRLLYYNAFTEDLFYWDNDLDGNSEHKLIIQPNNYTRWVLEEQGQGNNIIDHFQRYTSNKLTPKFSENFSEVVFSFERGNNEVTENIKISKGEESNFIWSIFYSSLEQIIEILSVTEIDNRETNKYDNLKYVFIDDPVTSLDENHLIESAVNIAKLIRSDSSGLKFIITTHNPLFYNILYNELKLKGGYVLSKLDNWNFTLEKKQGCC